MTAIPDGLSPSDREAYLKLARAAASTPPLVDVERPPPQPPASDQNRIGDWGMTYTGRRYWPADPRVGDIGIEDIAHALASQCRFAGHTRAHYSVGQHSVLVSRCCSPANQLAGLLHDSAEAYIQDIIRPLKPLLGGYHHLENAWALTIGQRFDLGDQLLALHPEIKRADRFVLVAERRDLMPAWPFPPEPALEERIQPWSADRAEIEFIAEFHRLRIRALAAGAGL